MELQGKVIAALPERSGVSQRGEWKSQEFVIETHDAQYPRKLVFTVFGIEINWLEIMMLWFAVVGNLTAIQRGIITWRNLCREDDSKE